MAEVLSPAPPAHSQSPAASPAASLARIDIMASGPSSPTAETTLRAQPRSRLSTSARSSNRLSNLSRHTSHSRTTSTPFPAFPSSLAYASVRDFAYPVFHPMHYGPLPEAPSGTTTPGSEWSSSRRLSDPMDAWSSSRGGNWGAGPWGGDGVMYSDPAQDDGEALPATSFGEEGEEDSAAVGLPHNRRGKHRKSKSYTDFTELDRGRRHDGSSGSNSGSTQARNLVGGDADSSPSSSRLDPAGQDSLRQSRSYGRRDPHLSATLPSRSFHTGHLPEPDADEDLLPLDAEQSAHAQSPQRASMGPEDELYAGESLALYSFEPENPNELRLREGQVILVSYRHGQGWLVAEDPETGEQGLVPEEYVRLIREIESWDPERGGFIDEEDESGEHGNKVSPEQGQTPMLAQLRSQPQPQSEKEHQKAADDDEAAAATTADDASKAVVDSPSSNLQADNTNLDLRVKNSDLLEGRPDSAHGQP